MRSRHRSTLLVAVAMIGLPVLAAGQALPYPAGTGRAVGANEISAQELKKKLDTGEKVLLIDVRDAPLYEKETIPGATNIPFPSLQDALKDIPKDRTLAFT
jgi:3-mercaptopyruvate sulfurtransferase SseA